MSECELFYCHVKRIETDFTWAGHMVLAPEWLETNRHLVADVLSITPAIFTFPGHFSLVLNLGCAEHNTYLASDTLISHQHKGLL